MPKFIAYKGGAIRKSSYGGGRVSTTSEMGHSFQVRVQIEGLERASQDMKDARKQVNTRMREAMLIAGESEALPFIHQGFARKKSGTSGLPVGMMANSLFVKKDRSDVFIGSKLPKKFNRALGWIDFGGQRSNDTEKRTGNFTILNVLNQRHDRIEKRALKEVMRVFDGFDHAP